MIETGMSCRQPIRIRSVASNHQMQRLQPFDGCTVTTCAERQETFLLRFIQRMDNFPEPPAPLETTLTNIYTLLQGVQENSHCHKGRLVPMLQSQVWGFHILIARALVVGITVKRRHKQISRNHSLILTPDYPNPLPS